MTSNDDVPFADLINHMSGGRSIIPTPKGHPLIQALGKNLNTMLKKSRHTNYVGGRINEVGTSLETEIKSFIDTSGLGTCMAKPRSGYPDLVVSMRDGDDVYIEVKTTSEKPDSKSTLRAFYISSGKHIQTDAHHILIHFFVNRVPSTGTKAQFELHAWAIRDLHSLKVRLKNEYNASMKDFKQLPVLASS